MAQDQGKTFNTVGDLRNAIQALPAETKLGFISQDQSQSGAVESDQGLDGISMVQYDDRVAFSSVKGKTSGPS